MAEVGVGFVEAEAATGGEVEGLVEVVAGAGEVAGVRVEGGAGEEAEGNAFLDTGAAEAVDGLVEMGGGGGDVGGGVTLGSEEVGAAEGEMVEGDAEEPEVGLGPLQRLRGAFPHVGVPAQLEQEVAVLEALERVEQRVGRLSRLLHALGFFEVRGGLLPEARRMQGRGQHRSRAIAMEGVAALVGELDALRGLRHCIAQLAVGSAEARSRLDALMAAWFQSSWAMHCSRLRRSNAAASGSRPSARSAKPAAFSTKAWSASVNPGASCSHGGAKNAERTATSLPKAPSFLALKRSFPRWIRFHQTSSSASWFFPAAHPCTTAAYSGAISSSVSGR